MQVHLRSLGCRLNEAELEQWGQEFRRAGHDLIDDPAQADLTVLNTCAVTAVAARKSRQQIRRLARQNPAARLVVSGCYATLEPDQVAAELGVDLVVPNATKGQLVALTRQALALPTAPAAGTEPAAAALFARGRSRAFVKVQDGCRYSCTFCITTIARGAERSRPVAEVVAEVNNLHAAGLQEVVLTGVQLAGYDADGHDLAGLLATLLSDTDVPRIRLGSLEPWGLPERFFELFANPRLQPHLHLPLQSGSDRVLRRMARRCWRADFERLVATARDVIADLNLSTDVIVGFPGEDDTDWQHTMAIVAQTGFSQLHIFPYSPRSGTRAASMTGQVDDAVKRARVQQLHDLGRRLRRATLAQFCGRQFPILWEMAETAGDGQRCYSGYTPNYLRVRVATGHDVELSHSIRPARLIGVAESGDHAVAQLTD